MLITTSTGIRSKSRLQTLALFIVCCVLLIVPVFFSNYRFDSWFSTLEFATTSIILAFFLTGFRLVSAYSRLLAPLFWVTLAILFIVRLTLFLVLDFSGEGFTDNFYAHISMQAAAVALREYTPTLLLALFVFTLLCKAIIVISRKAAVKPIFTYIVIVISLLLLSFIPFKSPEQQILTNYIHFKGAMNPGELSPQDIQDLKHSGLVNLEANKKANIVSTTGSQPQNLILVYLESFHLAFTDDGPFPDLTPHINQLKRKYGHHSNWLSSADATMEAIISTQCGTLVSTPQGSNTFANTESILPNLACLPDVLHNAGYYQVFLGGFDKNFSGKDLFLTDHNYDEVIGWEEWQLKGFKSKDGYWGLPDDELFKQAIKRSSELAKENNSQPYNLTLLTLSTHPPGFAASSCTPYTGNPDASRLLQAIHCTDQLVGQFVQDLQAAKLLDNTTLVITGDHDIFNLPEVREHFPDLNTDPRLLNIIISPKKSFSYQDQVNVAYDLAPTLLDLLEVEHNIQFVWGHSVFDSRRYHVSRRFRGFNSDNLEFQGALIRGCPEQHGVLTPPLDNCEHDRLLKLSDRYLYGFYDQGRTPPALCDADHKLQIEVTSGKEPISIHFLGSELANSFAYNGKPMKPNIPGFYLFIKATPNRAANFYYFGLDHIYWQIQLVNTLMGLDTNDHFILIYKPADGLETIEPLARLLLNYGFNEQNLKQPFIMVANGDPNKQQVFHDRGETAATITLQQKDCALLVPGNPDHTVIERKLIDEMLKPYIEQFPDI